MSNKNNKNFSEINFKTENDRNLYGWWIDGNKDAPLLILVHGWGRNCGRMLPYIEKLYKEGYNLLAFDSRNHGISDKDEFSSMPKFTEDILEINKQNDLHAECTAQSDTFQYRDATVEYYKYLNTIPIEDRRILAHLYVWHMGDMYGGQMINRVLGINSPSLTFQNRAQLIQKLEQKLDIDLVDEAKVAFEWANKILQSYDVDLL